VVAQNVAVTSTTEANPSCFGLRSNSNSIYHASLCFVIVIGSVIISV